MRRVVASFGLRGVGMGLQFVGSVLAARLLGVEGFGVYTYAFTWVVILGALAQLGFGALAARELPRHVADGAPGLARGYLRLAGLTTLAGCALVAAGLAAASGLGAAPGLGWPLVALGVAVQASGMVMSGALNGMQRIVQAQALDLALRPAVFLGGLGLVWLGAAQASAEAVFVLAVLGSGVSLVGSAVLLRRALRRDLPQDPAARPEWRLRPWTAAAVALLATSMTSMMMTNLDVLMVGALGTAEEVGRYRAASRGVDLVLIATGIAVQVMGPMLARALAEGRMGEARGLIGRAAGVMALAGLPLVAGLGLFAEAYLGLFGPGFVPAADAMRLLLLGQLVAILCGPVGMTLVMTGRERLVLWANLGALAVNLGLNLVLIPRFGIEGAAVATLISLAGVRIAMLVALLRAGLDPTLAGPLRAALARGR